MTLLLKHIRTMCSAIEMAINRNYHKKSTCISSEVLSDVLSIVWSKDNEFLSILEEEIGKEILDRNYLELRSKIFLSLNRNQFEYQNGEVIIESVNNEFDKHEEFMWWCEKLYE